MTHTPLGRLLWRHLALPGALVVLMAGTSSAAFITFESTGVDAAAITPTRDAFRTAVGGGTVAGANGSFGGVRREINWDGVPNGFATPTRCPPTSSTSTRPAAPCSARPGPASLSAPTPGWRPQSCSGFPNDFQVVQRPASCSPPSDSSITDVIVLPAWHRHRGDDQRLRGVFVDVEVASITKMEFFNQNNALIFSRFALAGGNQGLRFLGAVAKAGERISRVRITSGANTIVANGQLGNPMTTSW